MAVNTTLIFTDANKSAAIEAVNSFRGYQAPFTWASNINIELTDGENTFWALSGWVDDAEMNILINDYVLEAHFPADIDAALSGSTLSKV
jgi:hypothetical protein